MDIFKRVLGAIFQVRSFILLVFALLFVRAFFSFNPSFDYLWYHLPISLKMYGQTTYVLTGFDQAMYEAMPPIVHIFQGLPIWLLGKNSLGNCVNYIGFMIAFGLIWNLRNGKFSPIYFLLGLLSIPLFVAQIYTGFIDVWCNLWLLLSFVAYFDILEKGPTRKNILVFSVGVLFATLSKYQMWPVVGIICLFASFEIVKTMKLRGAIVVLCLGLAVCYWPIRNVIKFGNPTFPYSVLGMSFSKESQQNSVQAENISSLQLYEGFRNFPRPVLFLMSAFEVTRLMPYTHEMQWTHEQWSIDETKNPNYRMGGWSFLTVGIFIFVAVMAMRSKIFPKKIMWTSLATAIVLVSFLPQSYELRYYLFIPFIGAYIFSEYTLHLQRNSRLKNVLVTLTVVSSLLVLCSRAFLPFTIHSVEDFITEKERAFWQNPPPNSEQNPACVIDSPARMLYWAGPNFNTVWVKRCD